MIAEVCAWFWNPQYWLPEGIDWEDLKPNGKVNYAKFEDLLYPIPMAVGFIFIRQFIEKYIYQTIGLHLGVKNVKKFRLQEQGPHEKELESAFRLPHKLSSKEIELLAKKLDLEVREVERWLRRRLIRDKPTTLDKFTECGWRLSYYTFSLWYGVYMLWDKPWFWNISKCYENYPHHNLSADVWWYYMFSSSFYWSLAFSQFSDVKRKDFWQMFAHHVVTIFLLGFSWTTNLWKIGSLVLLLHDIADVFMELAKMAKYAEFHRLCNFLFATFTFLWIFTRVGVFPLYIIRSTITEGYRVSGIVPGLVLNFMLLSLLCLHVFWTSLLVQAVYKAITQGSLEKDSRSSSDEADLELEDEQRTKEEKES